MWCQLQHHRVVWHLWRSFKCVLTYNGVCPKVTLCGWQDIQIQGRSGIRLVQHVFFVLFFISFLVVGSSPPSSTSLFPSKRWPLLFFPFSGYCGGRLSMTHWPVLLLAQMMNWNFTKKLSFPRTVVALVGNTLCTLATVTDESSSEMGFSAKVILPLTRVNCGAEQSRQVTAFWGLC